MATYQLTQTGAQVQANLDAVEAGDIVYLTTAPNAANPSGKLKIVVLEEEPSTRYEGYIYIVKATPGPGITDLTGTKWLLNNSVYITQEISYNINCSYDGYDFETIDFRYYTANNKIWKGLLLNEDYAIAEITAQENPIEVINGDKVLEITGGTDATNSDLIAWLQANATQVPINLISFTIDGTQYQAEEGMTWAQWCSSSYNTDGFIGDGSVIINSSYTRAVATSSSGFNYVSSSSTITAGFTYYLRNYGG